ncbi:hypothetical protein CF386_04505 [Paraphotobacterium marinum]|uniref:RDD domain-containing protein n=1 Tax=Paraphotobacterium marinum TaxID=1755811 RepID=A0A220VDA8_9GAMM|nr:hypothetical protein CF386_04505 [Paraphotobacterium marinum]
MKNKITLFYKLIIAFVYDLILITSLICFFTFVYLIILNNFINISQNIEISNVIKNNLFLNFILYSIIIITPVTYYLIFMIKRRQTIGMRAFNLYLKHQKNDRKITIIHLMTRLIFSIFNCGVLLILFTKKNLSLQDKLSNTKIIENEIT